MRHQNYGGPQREGQWTHPPWEVAKHRVRPSREYVENLLWREYGGSEKDRRAEERRKAMLSRKAAQGDSYGVFFDAPAASAATASAASNYGHASADHGSHDQATAPVHEDAGQTAGAYSSPSWAPGDSAAAWRDARRGAAWQDEAWRWDEWPCDESRASDAEHAAQVFSEARYQGVDANSAPSTNWRGAQSHTTWAQTGVAGRDYSAEEKARRAELRRKDKEARTRAEAARARAAWDASQAAAVPPPWPKEEPAVAEEGDAEAAAAAAPPKPKEAAGTAAAAADAPGGTGGAAAAVAGAGADTGGTGQVGAEGAGAAPAAAPAGDEAGDAAGGVADERRLVKVKHGFDGTEFGEDYLVLSLGDELQELREEAGWMFGRRIGEPREGTVGPSEGWYPPSYAS